MASHETRLYVGAKVKEARQAAGLSHDKAVALTGIGRQHQIKLEKGQHLPRPETLEKLTRAYGQPIDFFLPPRGGDNE